MIELVAGVSSAFGAASFGLWKSCCQVSWSVPVVVKEPRETSEGSNAGSCQ